MPAGSSDKPKQAPPWAALVHHDFFWLWTSGVFLNISMVLRTLIAAQWLYEETGSAKLLGLLGVVQFLQVPLGLYGGTLADRFDRKKLMIFTQVVAAVILLGLTWLAATGALAPWHIFAVTAISAIANTMGGSARPAMLPRVVPRHLLTRAVAILSISGQLSQIGAPLVFWGLYDSLGAAVAFGVATITAVGSVLSPLLIKASGKPEIKGKTSTIASLAEGFRFMRHHPLLPGLYLMDIGVTVVSFYRQLYPVFARELYNLGARGTGLLTAANSAGSIVGTLLVFFADRIPRKGVIILVSTLIYTIFVFFFGFNTVFFFGLVIMAIMGLTDSMSVTMRLSIVQLTTPDEMLGRASSVRNIAAMTANNIGQIEVGLMSAAIGAGNTMMLGGIIGMLMVALTSRFFPGLRGYEYRPGQPMQSLVPPRLEKP